MCNGKLRSYQKEAIESIKSSIEKNGGKIIVNVHNGFGDMKRGKFTVEKES